jgi:uncharacterized protein YkwD
MPAAVRAVLALVAIVSSLAFAPAASAGAPTSAERALLQAVNATRAAHGLGPLRFSWPLQNRAHAYARWLIRTDNFVHASSLPPNTRENLAWATSNIASARQIVRMWLDSPGHRVALLWRGASRAGVGVARGSYRGYRDVRVAVLRVRP